jgi:hypothetical protein
MGADGEPFKRGLRLFPFWTFGGTIEEIASPEGREETKKE